MRDLFDDIICLVADNETIRDRLETRTTNTFGKHPEELAAALGWNDDAEVRYRRLGATIIDGTRRPPEVVEAILSAAAKPLDTISGMSKRPVPVRRTDVVLGTDRSGHV